MSTAFSDPRMAGWLWGGIGVIALLLMLAVAVCVLHGDDGMSADLCAAMVAGLFVVFLPASLARGWLIPEPVRAVRRISLHLPDPPPRHSLF